MGKAMRTAVQTDADKAERPDAENNSFRELRRKKQVICREECIEILMNELRGVLSVRGDNGYPYGIPMNHYYDPGSGIIYFHSGRGGHKLDSISACDKVSFCVIDGGKPRDNHWSLDFRSVVVFGRVRVIDDPDAVYSVCRKLSYRFTDDEDYIKNELINSGPGTVLLALTPEHISGKRVNES